MMIESFSVENYKSINDRETLILKASTDKEHPENLISKDKIKFNKVISIYGGNSAGKTNLLRSIQEMKNMVINSKDIMVDEKLPYEPCLFDISKKHDRTYFEIQFFINKKKYAYGFTYNDKSIIDESLYHYPKNQPALIFERQKDHTLKGNSEYRNIFQSKGNEKRLILSVLASWTKEEEILEVYDFFNKGIIIHNVIKCLDFEEKTIKEEIEKYLDDDDDEYKELFNNYFIKILKELNTNFKEVTIGGNFNISDEILNVIIEEENKIKSEILEAIRKKIKMEEKVYIVYEINGKEVKIPLKEESRGIKKLFDLGLKISKVMHTGSCLVYDELEMSFHPILVRKIVEIFLNENINNKNSQLIFTTHDSNLLDLSLLRRDQIWFVERSIKTLLATKITCLAEIKDVRKTENIEKNYLKGKYIDIPMFTSSSTQLEKLSLKGDE